MRQIYSTLIVMTLILTGCSTGKQIIKFATVPDETYANPNLKDFFKNNSNPNIETNHLLKALLDDEDSPVDFLLKKNNVNVAFVESKVDEAIKKLPKVSGGEPAQNVSRDLSNALLKANASLKSFKAWSTINPWATRVCHHGFSFFRKPNDGKFWRQLISCIN